MLDCWSLVVPCIFAEGLSAALREVGADLDRVLRQLGLDRTLIGDAGWAVAAILWLRLRFERRRYRRARLEPPNGGVAPTREPTGPALRAD